MKKETRNYLAYFVISRTIAILSGILIGLLIACN